jgi:glycerophosphoryl diester phosphodiesterase
MSKIHVEQLTNGNRGRTLLVAIVLTIVLALAATLTARTASAEDVVAAADTEEVVFEENFDGVADGELPTGWTVGEGEWEVVDGELIGVSTASAELSRISFGPSLRNYRIEATVRFESTINARRWAGVILDIASNGSEPWNQAIFRRASTDPDGVEFARRSGGWQVTDATSAPSGADIGTEVRMAVEVQGTRGRWYWDDELILTTSSIQRTPDGVLGLVVSGARVAFDDIRVTRIEPSSLLRPDNEPAYAIAHRGYSTIAPENMLVAAETARLAGVRGIELDVMDTADGVQIMWHDATVDAKTDGSGRVDELKYNKIRKLDAGSWFSPVYEGTRIPTWEETLDLLQGRGVEIVLDQKVAAVAPTVQAIVDREMEDEVIFTSFSQAEVNEVRELAPRIRRGLITSTMHADPVAVAQALDLSVYSVGANEVINRPDVVDDLRAAGVAVVVWTVNDAERWQTLIEIGVDGIITDRAAEFVGYRERVMQEQ